MITQVRKSKQETMNTIYKQGNLRGEKIIYQDGVGCTIWYPMPFHDDLIGVCFDFAADDIDDMIKLLQTLKAAEAEENGL